MTQYNDISWEHSGAWNLVLQHYSKWKADRGHSSASVNGLPADPSMDDRPTALPAVQAPEMLAPSETPQSPRKLPQLFGAPIDFRGLRHAPINEQGVVYLFGMVSRELGFSVEALQQGFPDCEGKSLHDKRRQLWAKARIEFEFRAFPRALP